MYSDKKNIGQLAALLEAHDIHTVVLCPGSRNTPLIHTFVEHPFFQCHSVTDERSAGFIALGMALAQKKPVVVCCTSGTALVNLHPAVCEAYYQQVPLIVVSADRPQAWIGQMDGQTLPQAHIFGTMMRKSVQLPEINTAEDEWYCNRLINEAILETDHHVCGPVHINIPLSEPLFQYTEESLPQVRRIQRVLGEENIHDLFARISGYSRCMVVCGQCLPEEAESIRTRLENFPGVLLSEHLSNIQMKHEEEALRFFDRMLANATEEQQKSLAPDLLITMGGHIVSKRLKKLLRRFSPQEHWHISPQGEIVDLFGCLTHVVEATPIQFLKEGFKSKESCPFKDLWLQACGSMQVYQPEYSSLQAVECWLNSLPSGKKVIHLANSSAVRLASCFPLPSDTVVYCNRGTNGIEGSLSSAIGYAAQSDCLNFVLIGDLSFFYDMNALWNRLNHAHIRILLLNNGGGGIFHTLPGMNLESESCSYVDATHQTAAQGWAEACGFHYEKAENAAELQECMVRFTDSKCIKPMLLEVFLDIEKDAEELRRYLQSGKRQG